MGILRMASVTGAFVSVFFGACPPVLAQQGSDWIVLSATAEHLEGDEDASLRMEAALAEAGETVLRGSRAAQRLELELSRPFSAAESSLRARIAEAQAEALRAVASGRNQDALDLVGAVLEAAEPHLASIGRDPRSADDLANLCWYAVRAHLQKGDDPGAIRQRDLCRRVAPGFTLTDRMHPPEVHEVSDEWEQESVLVVQLVGTSGDCVIRAQGRVVEQGLRARIPIPPGRVFVQAECGEAARPGRVHEVIVPGTGVARIDIDVGFEDAIRTRDRLRLRYDSADQLQRSLPDHLGRVAELLGVERALILVRAGGIRWQSYSLAPAQPAEPLAEVQRPSPPPPVDNDGARRIVGTLLGRNVHGQAQGRSGTPTRSRRWIGGLSIAIAGLAVTAGSWVARSREKDAESALEPLGRLDPGFLSAVDDVDAWRRRTVGLASAGGALLSVGLPLMLPPRAHVPWWSWVLGGIGAGLTAWGTIRLFQDSECINAVCTRETMPGIESAFLFAYGVPLLLAPIAHSLMDAAELSVSGRGAKLTVRF